MTTIKTFKNNEILKAEDMNSIGGNINEINSIIETVPHGDTEYPSRVKVGEGLEFDLDDYNNQTLFGKYNSVAPDTEHYLLFAIGDGTAAQGFNAIEILKKTAPKEGENPYILKVGGVELMNYQEEILTKLEDLEETLRGEYEESIARMIGRLPDSNSMESAFNDAKKAYEEALIEYETNINNATTNTLKREIQQYFKTRLDDMEARLKRVDVVVQENTARLEMIIDKIRKLSNLID